MQISEKKEKLTCQLTPRETHSTSWYISFRSFLCEQGESRSGVVQRKLFSWLLAPCHRGCLVPLWGPSRPHSPHPGSEVAAREMLLPPAPPSKPQNAWEDWVTTCPRRAGVRGPGAPAGRPAGECWACSWLVSEARGRSRRREGSGGRRSGAVASHQAEDCSRHAQAPRRFCVREFCRRRDPCEGGRAARGERPRVTSAAGRIITTWPGHCFPLQPGAPPSGGGAEGWEGACFSQCPCPSLSLGEGRVGEAFPTWIEHREKSPRRVSVSSFWNGGEVSPSLELRMSCSLRSG